MYLFISALLNGTPPNGWRPGTALKRYPSWCSKQPLAVSPPGTRPSAGSHSRARSPLLLHAAPRSLCRMCISLGHRKQGFCGFVLVFLKWLYIYQIFTSIDEVTEPGHNSVSCLTSTQLVTTKTQPSEMELPKRGFPRVKSWLGLTKIGGFLPSLSQVALKNFIVSQLLLKAMWFGGEMRWNTKGCIFLWVSLWGKGKRPSISCSNKAQHWMVMSEIAVAAINMSMSKQDVPQAGVALRYSYVEKLFQISLWKKLKWIGNTAGRKKCFSPR